MTSYHNGPGAKDLFGRFGGQYVVETLMPLIFDLTHEYEKAENDSAFQEELAYLQHNYVGRPSPLYFAERLTGYYGGTRTYLEHKKLNHTGAHRTNDYTGQVLLTRCMGKKRIITETDTGMHGIAAVTIAARFSLQYVIYVGTTNIDRQQANVSRMKLLGTEVIPMTAGIGALRDVMNGVLRDWTTSVDNISYLIGTIAGPHPYPVMIRDFQTVIGKETREQLAEKGGCLPDSLVVYIGNGSSTTGLSHPFLGDAGVQIVDVETVGRGIDAGKRTASLSDKVPGVLYDNRTFLLQGADGQIIDTHSVSTGLDYPGIGLERVWLHDTSHVEYTSITGDEVLGAFHTYYCLKGIIPVLKGSHALAEVFEYTPSLPKERIMVMNPFGHGGKDMRTVMHHIQQESEA